MAPRKPKKTVEPAENETEEFDNVPGPYDEDCPTNALDTDYSNPYD